MTTDSPHPAQYQAGEAELTLCRLDAIIDGESKEVFLYDDRISLCLVRQGMTVYAYINSCPHTGAPLNWDRDRFLTRDGDMIQCTLHGALFRIGDGLCTWGPCLHQRLTAVPIVIRDGMVILATAESRRLLRAHQSGS